MKKLFFLMVLLTGGAMLVRAGQVTLSADNQVHVAGWTVPLPQTVQNSPVMALVGLMMRQQTAPAADPRYGAGQATRPAMPNVTSATSTYSANQAPPSQMQGSDQLSAVAKALRGQ